MKSWDSPAAAEFITRLTTDAELDEARSQLRKVVHSVHPLGMPFTSSVRHRTILFPSGFLFNDELIGVLTAASHAIGEYEAYYSAVGGAFQGWDHFSSMREWHARVDFRIGVDDALRTDGIVDHLECALYSTRGTWAAVTYDADYCVVAGPDDFIAVIASMQDIDQMAVEMLVYQVDKIRYLARSNPPAARMLGWSYVNLYEHIYDVAVAERYIEGSGLFALLNELHGKW